MKSKKAFTLVELMIVIVIMGVLVAVAVPVFGLVTKNAEKKTCGANMDIIAKGAQQCALTDTDSGAKVIFRNDGTTTVDIRTQEDARQAFTDAYLACFEGGKFPLCPTEGGYYTVTLSENGKYVNVECKNSGSGVAHGAK